MDDLDLSQEEIETLREDRPCQNCGHLTIFHHYAGGSDECRVNGCHCEL